MGRPIGVSIIAIIMALSAIANIVVGLDTAGLYDLGLGSAADSTAQGWGVVIGGVVTLLVALGLWSLAGWAWTLSVVVLVIRVGLDVWVMFAQGFSSTVGLAAVIDAVISALLLLYLFSGGVRAAFNRA